MSATTKSISIIDRKKNIFKLQQGEYVAAEKVENIYMKDDLLAEIFIHGESTETFCIAIGVPNKKKFIEFAQSKGVEGDLAELCKHEKIRAEVVIHLGKVGKEAGLMSFEQAKNIHLEIDSFQTLGIVTNTMKIQRHEAKKHFKEVIDQLYKEGMLKADKK
jgi:long-chain acyl-CoA synthetase